MTRICPKCQTKTEKFTACGCDTCDNPNCDYRWFCYAPSFLSLDSIFLGLGIKKFDEVKEIEGEHL